MKTSILTSASFLVVFFSVVLLLGCSKNNPLDPDEEKCGEPYEWVSQNEFFVNSTINGSYREFYIEDLNRPDDICTEEHPTVTYNLYTRGGTTPPPDMTVTAKAYWSIFSPMTTPMTYDAAKSRFTATLKPGLKDAFPDKPGHINTQIILKFKSVGGQALDSIRADSFVHSPEMIVNYKIYKPK